MRFGASYPERVDSLDYQWVFLQKTDEHPLDNLIKSHRLNVWNPDEYLGPVRVEDINHPFFLLFFFRDGFVQLDPCLIDKPLGPVSST